MRYVYAIPVNVVIPSIALESIYDRLANLPPKLKLIKNTHCLTNLLSPFGIFLVTSHVI